MKCSICKHGNTCKGAATMTLERNEATLVFKNVPADIRENCGEVFHDESTTHALLPQAESAAARGVELDVRQFTEAA